MPCHEIDISPNMIVNYHHASVFLKFLNHNIFSINSTFIPGRIGNIGKSVTIKRNPGPCTYIFPPAITKHS